MVVAAHNNPKDPHLKLNQRIGKAMIICMINEKNALDFLYVNHAEVAWHERRRAWVGDISQRSPRLQSISIREKIPSWSTTYKELLSTIEPFKDPIPLAEMVDSLVDIWLEEGLYGKTKKTNLIPMRDLHFL
ncbi:hypothetical protein POM88_002983 [Heracleum sosnowskyi]|uniref:Gag1-like clamp domain-containing protein n=1 Tax=Heracleum sosnowskyi TaxID=360622 RepID=A0AAD8JHR7_9APIA|nr:hypothetical protein POM88_002983 [Heracleum sosnowskyi]